MMKTKQVTVRLPQTTITHIAKLAKLAGVSPTQVYNVLLAAYVITLRDAASPGSAKENT